MAGGAVTRTEPWAEQKPYLEQGFREAGRLYEQGPPQYYPGATLAGPDLATQTAERGTLGYALGPRPQALQGAAETAMVRGLSGAVKTQVMDPMVESYRNKMMSDLLGKTLPGIRQSLVQYQPGGGSRGDILQANVISAAQQDLQNQIGQLYGGAFQSAQERVPQFQGLYPTTMQAPFGLMDRVAGVGADRQAMAQEAINRDMMRHQYQQNAQQQALASYMAGISGDYGGTVTQTGSPLSQLGSVAGIIGSLMG